MTDVILIGHDQTTGQVRQLKNEDIIVKPSGIVPAGTAAGQLLWWNGTAWVIVPAGIDGYHLRAKGAAIPVWEALPVGTDKQAAYLTFGANFTTTGKYAMANGTSVAAEQSTSTSPAAALPSPVAAASFVLAWHVTTSGGHLRIASDGATVGDVTMSGLSGATAIATTCSVGSKLAVGYLSGTAPGAGVYGLWALE